MLFVFMFKEYINAKKIKVDHIQKFKIPQNLSLYQYSRLVFDTKGA